jgi:hypothetical protein
VNFKTTDHSCIFGQGEGSQDQHKIRILLFSRLCDADFMFLCQKIQKSLPRKYFFSSKNRSTGSRNIQNFMLIADQIENLRRYAPETKDNS